MTEINEIKITYFKKHLRENCYSENTIRSYSSTVTQFLSTYDIVTSDNLVQYRNYLLTSGKSSTINQKINAINRYVKFENNGVANAHLIKVRRDIYIDNVITNEEYELFKEQLLKDKKYKLYFLIRFMASTGMRISEVLQMTTDDIRIGHCNIRSKGNKERRVYIPSSLSYEAMMWMAECNIKPGFIFTNRYEKCITPSGARYLIKHYGLKYGIPESHLHPHAFRHRFALNFINVHKDISMLSDLLGHESIETTRIYLKKTADEQKNLIDLIVNW